MCSINIIRRSPLLIISVVKTIKESENGDGSGGGVDNV
jgi:hypothetical protein